MAVPYAKLTWQHSGQQESVARDARVTISQRRGDETR
jgi:hypothetical protein